MRKNNGTGNVVRRRDVDRLKWSDEKNKMLRDLLELGLSSAMAAQRMGISKNAVVGQAHRLGIVYGRTAKKEKSRKNFTLPPRPKKISPPSATVEGMRDVKHLENEPTPIGGLASPPEDKACRWVHGDPATMTWQHCGHEQRTSSMYCDHHHMRAYHRVPYKGNVVPLKLGVKRR